MQTVRLTLAPVWNGETVSSAAVRMTLSLPIRAGEPLSGRDVMFERLKRTSRAKKTVFPESPEGWSEEEWAGRLRGPGRLCAAMGITRADNGRELFSDPDFYLAEGCEVPKTVLTGPRIGIDYAGEDRDRPWRFVWDREADLSGE